MENRQSEVTASREVETTSEVLRELVVTQVQFEDQIIRFMNFIVMAAIGRSVMIVVVLGLIMLR